MIPPPPLISPSVSSHYSFLSHWASCCHQTLRDHQAFNQAAIIIEQPPLFPPFMPHWGLPHVRHSDVYYLLCLDGWAWVRAHYTLCCESLIYANRSDPPPPPCLCCGCLLMCLPDWLCLHLEISVAVWCARRYFGDVIGDVFTKEDFELYRWHLQISHAFSVYILSFHSKWDTWHILN